MTTNREWLYSLEPSELSAWFDADCSETESINKLTAERDAAYAKNRALKQHIANMQEGRNGWHTKAEKLQAKVTELTAERNELQAKVDELIAECDSKEQAEPYLFGMPPDEVLGKLKQVDELKTEREALNRRTLQLELHIEQLRSKLSRACDNAHDTLRIMDEGMA